MSIIGRPSAQNGNRARAGAQTDRLSRPSAAVWVAMYQPSASSAIDPNNDPAVISPTIMTTVSATTNQVRRSFWACLGPTKT
jgi:hypothetical protein